MPKKYLLAIILLAVSGCSKQPKSSNESLSVQSSKTAAVPTVTTSAGELHLPNLSSTSSEVTNDNKNDKQWLLLKLKSGESLTTLLAPFAFSDRDSWLVEQSVATWTSLTKLKAGQAIEVALREGEGEVELIRFELDFAKLIEIKRAKDGWQASLENLETVTRTKRLSTVVESSFFVDASKAGVPNDIINQGIIALSHLVDFQREIYAGDQIDFVYQQKSLLLTSRLAEKSDIATHLQHVALLSGKEEYRLYQFSDESGMSAFYHEDGRLAQSFLMKTPLNGARLSSSFGKRHHPVLGYTRMHQGIDFGAPIGTPIMAAGSGEVIKANWGGSFGNRIILAHGNGYQTLYAHLKEFAKGIKAGAKVKQGEVIGYLGNTGLSQARHLHYEVHKDGKAINPLTLKQPKYIKLEGKQLKRFIAYVAQVSDPLNDKDSRIASQIDNVEQLQVGE
ncbi:peptidoglycan DD-metalloendopeptidase family protein [Pseudoalteromonas sp. SCSIO 43201]|uniref:M23 family metallopeptidase n=1 Tax=Pseudoalteromonas sp. SCSIO 43201 TaxID=2822842 RepID=UPI0020766184|nr:peptidoglycan DD-metalloendopeptidase family protein [Pseudoalteromonas sp. SCSIO 43201]USD29916.1 peptidoglycan DD-metalloendopeptidase family protein [Pseudoalteromonas sp. SCSIO 43201]